MIADKLQRKMRLSFVLSGMVFAMLCLAVQPALAVVKGVKVSLQATPATVAVGKPVTLTATIQDSAGKTVTDETKEVVFNTTPPGAGQFSDVRKETTGGVANVTFTPGQAGALTITAGADLDGNGSIEGTEAGTAKVTAVLGGSKITLATTTTEVTARGIVRLRATIQDKDGKTVTVATDEVIFSTTPQNAGQFSEARKNAVRGVVDVTFTPTLAGSTTITAGADLDGNGKIEGSEQATTKITVVHGPAQKILVAAELPVIVADGKTTVGLTAQLRDADGNRTTRDSGTRVAFRVSGPADILRPDSTTVTSDTVTVSSGVARVTLRSRTAGGTVTITAEAVVAGQTIRGVKTIKTLGGKLTDFTFEILRKEITTDAPPLAIGVTLRDTLGNVPERTIARVRFRLTGTAGGALQDTILSTNQGRARTYYISEKPGVARITAEVIGLKSKSETITITIGAPKKIQLKPTRSTLTADGKDSTTVSATVTDAKGNRQSSDNTTTIGFATDGPGAVETSKKVTSGIATVKVRAGTKVGDIKVTATATGLDPATVTIATLAGAASKVALISSATSIPTDGVSTVTVTASIEDENGNTVTSDTTSVVKLTATGGGTITPDSVRVTNGMVTAEVKTGAQTGEITVTAASGNLTSATVTLTAVIGSASKVALKASADSILADGVATVTLTASIQDAGGNAVALDSTSVVQFKVTSGAGMVTPDSVKVAGGEATATLTATDEGSITITASSGTLTGGTATVIAKPKPAVKITLESSSPSLPADGSSMVTITAKIVDAKENVATTDNKTVVTFAITSGAGSIDSTSVIVKAGVAMAHLTAGVIDTPPGEVTVRATAPEAAKLEAGTITVALTRPLLDKIVLTASVVQNGTATLTATVFDTTGAPATTDNATTISFVVFSGSATVSPEFKTVVNGQATATLTLASGRALVMAGAPGLLQGWRVVRTPSTGVRAIDDIPPGPASVIMADTTTTTGKITVRWTLSADDRVLGSFPFGGYVENIRGVLRYDIYRQNAGGGGWELIGNAPFGMTEFKDPTAVPGTTYAYSVVAADMDNETLPLVRLGGAADKARKATLVMTPPSSFKPVVQPVRFHLSQNHPNPFNPETTINYSLPGTVPVHLEIYNALGQLVRTLVDGMQPAGYHTVVWNGQDAYGHSLSSGVYFYRLTAGSFSEVRRMLLMK